MKRLLIVSACATALWLQACATASPRQTAATSRADLDAAYALAVQRAALVEPSAVVHDLIAITRDNPRVTWNEDGHRVLAVSWMNRQSFTQYFQGQSHTTADEAHPAWVTMVPQVRDFCVDYRRSHTSATSPDVALRLKQYLGLRSDRDYDVFVEMWIDQRDLFRPCANPSPATTTCDVDPSGTFSAPGVKDYRQFFQKLYFDDFRTRPGVPWTGLGYTFDWGNPQRPEGASEFIVSPGAAYEIRRAVATGEYCATTNGT